jgi:hypothetical protein
MQFFLILETNENQETANHLGFAFETIQVYGTVQSTH